MKSFNDFILSESALDATITGGWLQLSKLVSSDNNLLTILQKIHRNVLDYISENQELKQTLVEFLHKNGNSVTGLLQFVHDKYVQEVKMLKRPETKQLKVAQSNRIRSFVLANRESLENLFILYRKLKNH